MALNLLRLFQQTNLDKPLGGRYKVISQLAAGGFGQTFLAEDLHLPGQPRCVVKQLKPQVSDAESLQTARRLFDTEAKVLYQLGNHNQIPRLLAHFEDDQEFYLAQELIEGHPLTEELASGQPWAETRVIALLQDIFNVLAFVHQQHVIHRDIKPSNLIRRRQDGRIVLIDFGAVKQVSTQMANPRGGQTNLTVSIGTQGYMPKEQLGGNPRFSSDVYAVGIVGIQALTGTHPRFLNEDPHTGEIIWRDRAHQVTPELIAILDKMVRYDFRARYVTAAEALEALRSLPPELLASVPAPQPLPDTGVLRSLPTEFLEPESSPQTLPDDSQTQPGPATEPLQSDPSSQPLPEASGAPPSQVPPSPSSTATGQTTPLLEPLPHNAPALSAPESAARGSVPVVITGGNQPSELPKTSLPTVALQELQEFIQRHGIKPWQMIAAVVALGATLTIAKTVLFPQPSTQTASNGGTAVESPVTPASPENQVAALLNEADSLREAENFSQAIATYEKAIALNPKEAKAYWGLCYSLNSNGQPQEAIAQCDKALALNPNYKEALWSKGAAYEQQNDYEKAIEFYDQALKIDPNYAEALNNKGVALLKQKRTKEALKVLEQATQIKPNWPDALANKANAHWSLKEYDKAIDVLEQALKIDPNHANANNLRQQARRKIGR